MIENKFKTTIVCLYGLAGFQFLSGLLVLILTIKSLGEIGAIENSGIRMPILLEPGIMLSSAAIPVMMGLFTIFVAREFRLKKSWAWLGAMFAFAFGMLSFAIPLCILGLVCLFHEKVRADYITKLINEI